MSLDNTGAGIGFVPAYQISALPWLTGSLTLSTSPFKISFPHVTKYVKVSNVSGSEGTRVGFTVNGINDENYFRVPAGEVVEFDVRVNEMYLRSDSGANQVDVFAGLTLIRKEATGFLTGSDAFTSPGSPWPGVG